MNLYIFYFIAGNAEGDCYHSTPSLINYITRLWVADNARAADA